MTTTPFLAAVSENHADLWDTMQVYHASLDAFDQHQLRRALALIQAVIHKHARLQGDAHAPLRHP